MRRLLTLRERLPGRCVERRRTCGKANWRCASGRPEDLHPQFGLSLLGQGKQRTLQLDVRLAEEARRGVKLHWRFQQLEARILAINLQCLLRKKQVFAKSGAGRL